MGLLDKVLSKQSGSDKPVSQPTDATSLSSMITAPPKQPGSEDASPKESLPPKTGETLPEAPFPEGLLPFPQRLIRQIKGKLPGKFADAIGKKSSPGKANEDGKASRAGSKIAQKGRRVIAIDVGTASIKVVELLRQGQRHVIVGLDISPIPTQIRKNAAALAVLQKKLLREMLLPARTKNAEIHLLIPDKSAQARTVNIPSGAAKELVNAIKFQIKKDLPFPLDVCEIKYRGFDPKKTGKQDIEILAADRRAVEAQLDLIDDIDLLPTVITAPSASSRFLVHDYTGLGTTPGAIVVVDIGASHTTITIVEDERVALSRTVVTGGDDFTSVLTGVALGAKGEELTDVQAEKYKIDVGLPAERDASMMKAATLMRPLAERISTEITRSLDFYRRGRTGSEKIILTGGGALLKRLPEFISDSTGVDVVIGAPTSRLTLRGGSSELLETTAVESGPLFLSALAVALDGGKDLNLIPKNIEGALKLDKAKGVIAPAALGLMMMMIFAYVAALGTRSGVLQESKKVTNQLKDLDQSRATFLSAQAQYNELLEQLKARQSDFDSIRMGEPEIPRYLKVFSNLTPDNVYLTKLATKFLTETAEQAAQDVNGKGGIENLIDKNAPLNFDVSSVLGTFTKSFGDPLSASNQERSQAPVKRPVFGRVIEVDGVIYPQGTLTDVQLVDYVFNLENSGHFRDVAVDSISTTDDGRIKFRIICGM